MDKDKYKLDFDFIKENLKSHKGKITYTTPKSGDGINCITDSSFLDMNVINISTWITKSDLKTTNKPKLEINLFKIIQNNNSIDIIYLSTSINTQIMDFIKENTDFWIDIYYTDKETLDTFGFKFQEKMKYILSSLISMINKLSTNDLHNKETIVNNFYDSNIDTFIDNKSIFCNHVVNIKDAKEFHKHKNFQEFYNSNFLINIRQCKYLSKDELEKFQSFIHGLIKIRDFEIFSFPLNDEDKKYSITVLYFSKNIKMELFRYGIMDKYYFIKEWLLNKDLPKEVKKENKLFNKFKKFLNG